MCVCTLFRNPLRTCAALTDSERGMRIVFSSITAATDQPSQQVHVLIQSCALDPLQFAFHIDDLFLPACTHLLTTLTTFTHNKQLLYMYMYTKL